MISPYREVVSHGMAGRDVALRDTNRPIHMVRAILEQTVPMHAGRFIAELRDISLCTMGCPDKL